MKTDNQSATDAEQSNETACTSLWFPAALCRPPLPLVDQPPCSASLPQRSVGNTTNKTYFTKGTSSTSPPILLNVAVELFAFQYHKLLGFSPQPHPTQCFFAGPVATVRVLAVACPDDELKGHKKDTDVPNFFPRWPIFPLVAKGCARGVGVRISITPCQPAKSRSSKRHFRHLLIPVCHSDKFGPPLLLFFPGTTCPKFFLLLSLPVPDPPPKKR